ncbi:MAG: hypothetical protein K6A40_05100, partial [Solobacterium sp.]|nr:hypothetical protein [Solobacterium sp.]
MGKLQEAQEIIDSLKDQADELQLAYLQGEIDYLNHSYKAAAESFRTVTQSKADETLAKRAYISLAETYRDSAKLSAEDPEHIKDAYTLMIQTLQEAMNEYDLSGNAVLWEMTGYAYYNRGTLEKDNDPEDLKAAVSAYRKVISLGVQKDYLYVNMFIAYQAMEDYTSAENVLLEMKELYPNSYQPYMYRSILLILKENKKPNAKRNYTEAYKEYQTAKELANTADSSSQLQQLEGLIQQLRDGGWIK